MGWHWPGVRWAASKPFREPSNGCACCSGGSSMGIRSRCAGTIIIANFYQDYRGWRAAPQHAPAGHSNSINQQQRSSPRVNSFHDGGAPDYPPSCRLRAVDSTGLAVGRCTQTGRFCTEGQEAGGAAPANAARRLANRRAGPVLRGWSGPVAVSLPAAGETKYAWIRPCLWSV
jgi:hypothetical protein